MAGAGGGQGHQAGGKALVEAQCLSLAAELCCTIYNGAPLPPPPPPAPAGSRQAVGGEEGSVCSNWIPQDVAQGTRREQLPGSGWWGDWKLSTLRNLPGRLDPAC